MPVPKTVDELITITQEMDCMGLGLENCNCPRCKLLGTLKRLKKEQMAVQQAAMESGLFEMQIDVMKKGEGGLSF